MVNGHRFSSALNTLRTQVFVTITWCQEAPDSTNSYPGILSFFNSWVKALRRRKWLLDQGARDVIIIVVWAEDLHYLYHAEDIATALG
jgi:hypothetical protein